MGNDKFQQLHIYRDYPGVRGKSVLCPMPEREFAPIKTCEGCEYHISTEDPRKVRGAGGLGVVLCSYPNKP